MTRRSFKTEDGYTVTAGWDRVLQHFFLDCWTICTVCNGQGMLRKDDPDGTITLTDCKACEDKGEQFLFDNLYDTRFVDTMGGMTLNSVQVVMHELVTEIPNQLFFDLLVDQRTDAGNVTHFYGTFGRTKQHEQQ